MARPVRLAAIVATLALMPAVAVAQTMGGGEREEVHAGAGAARTTWSVEIADERDEQSKGLMFRRSMPARTGMLFDFGDLEPVTMWMRNTFIPLDMVFICPDGTVARVAANTVPQSEAIVASGEPVRYVLEINAGEAKAHGLERGVRLASSGDRFGGERGDCAR